MILLLVALTLSASDHDLRRVLFPHGAGKMAFQDGSTASQWEGEGAPQLKMAVRYRRDRDVQVDRAQAVIAKLVESLLEGRVAVSEETKKTLRERVTRLCGGPMDSAEKALMVALDLEVKRLKLVRKAAAAAERRGETIPGIDVEVVTRLAVELDADAQRESVKTRLRAYRALADGLVAYLDGDLLGGIEGMRRAAKDAPDMAIVHVYLGSFYYLVRQPDKALAEWKLALELDPDNEEAKRAVQDFSAGTR